ncbi:unnamed protein product, partial [Brenthis ino]
MNVLRSPTGSDNQNERCASQPNLLNYGFSLNESNLSLSINRQKRKQPDQDSEIKEELVEIRNKMDKLLDFMGQFTEAQKLAADKLSQDVASIKDQVNNFKAMADNLVLEQSTIKAEVTELKVSTSTTCEKVESLQNEIEKLKMRSTESRDSLSNITENTMIELRERIAREKNLIITGILESKNPDENKRQSDDTNAINNILKDIYKECPNPIKIFRLGNHKEERCRPIKVYSGMLSHRLPCPALRSGAMWNGCPNVLSWLRVVSDTATLYAKKGNNYNICFQEDFLYGQAVISEWYREYGYVPPATAMIIFHKCCVWELHQRHFR